MFIEDFTEIEVIKVELPLLEPPRHSKQLQQLGQRERIMQAAGEQAGGGRKGDGALLVSAFSALKQQLLLLQCLHNTGSLGAAPGDLFTPPSVPRYATCFRTVCHGKDSPEGNTILFNPLCPRHLPG